VKLASGHYRYAIAIRDGANLWLTLWVRRSPKGEFFVLYPRLDPSWNPHTSYHLDGTLHIKSYDHMTHRKSLQPLTGSFHGTEHLGIFGGHGNTGIACDPTKFAAVVEVTTSVLGPFGGVVSVDLVQPGVQPITPLDSATMVRQDIFQDFSPWVVLRFWSHE